MHKAARKRDMMDITLQSAFTPESEITSSSMMVNTSQADDDVDETTTECETAITECEDNTTLKMIEGTYDGYLLFKHLY